MERIRNCQERFNVVQSTADARGLCDECGCSGIVIGEYEKEEMARIDDEFLVLRRDGGNLEQSELG